jgi:integrase
MRANKLKALEIAKWWGKLAKLSPDESAEFASFKPKGMYDGAGLMLLASSPSSASWLLRYQFGRNAKGRPLRRDKGLGGYPDVSLEAARQKAAAARRLLKADGKDPIDSARLEAVSRITFREAAEAFIASKKTGWGDKTLDQWEQHLSDYVYPIFGRLPVQAVDIALVQKALEPIWVPKPETGERVRRRIEAILRRETALGHRAGPNPAAWRENLQHILPKRSDVQPTVRHHAALPYAELPVFVADLRSHDATAARALQFLILTAGRTAEVLGATWDELDAGSALWTISKARMKAKRAHRVHLSAPALAILRKQHEATGGAGFVFPGMTPGKPLSNMALLMLLRRMERDDLTAHGFRATFKTWATEKTNFPREAIELSLAHAVGDAVEQAYMRGDNLKKRAQLMAAWGQFCTTAPGSKVIPIRHGR